MNENDKPLDDQLEEAVSEGAEVAEEELAEAVETQDEAVDALTGDMEPPAEPSLLENPPAIMERLAEDTTYDQEATSDDKLMAALSYASQLIIPLLAPIILLVSESSNKRPFQKYHAVQSLGLGVAIWVVQAALGVFSGIAAATVIGILCLCFLIPLMIVLWLLPLYYAVLALGGQRFTIPGLTQFLQDQNWL